MRRNRSSDLHLEKKDEARELFLLSKKEEEGEKKCDRRVKMAPGIARDFFSKKKSERRLPIMEGRSGETEKLFPLDLSSTVSSRRQRPRSLEERGASSGRGKKASCCCLFFQQIPKEKKNKRTKKRKNAP